MVKKSASELDDAAAKVEKAARKVAASAKARKIKKRMPAVLRVALSILMLMGLAIVFTRFILGRQFLYEPGIADQFMNEKPAVFWFSSLLVFLLMGVLAAILWRPFLAAGISFATISVLTFIHMQKYLIRAEPLLPSDFQLTDQVGEISQLVEGWKIVVLILGVVAVLVGSALLEYFVRKLLGTKRGAREPWWRRWQLVPRMTLALTGVTGFVLSIQFLLHHEPVWSTRVDWLDTLLVWGDQVENYDRNGFVIGFIYNLGGRSQESNDDYSRENLQEIYETYAEIKEKDTKREPLGEAVENVVIILGESFYDPILYEKYYAHTGGDVIPEVHEVFENYPSGYMYSPEYGGNTTNVEYAVLTGLSNYWAKTIVYTNYAAGMAYLPGVTSFAKQNGFQTTAIHSFHRRMYRRTDVYAAMLFDTFIDMDGMKHDGLENGKGFISDSELYAEALDYLKNDDYGKQLLGLITVQGHAPYDSAGYSKYNFRLYNQNSWSDSIEASYENLNHADEYLGEFLAEIDKLDEKTVVLWFGDHAAGVLNAYKASEDKELRDLAHLTPYFVYANFEIGSPYTEGEVAEMNKEQGFDFEEILKPSKLMDAEELAIDLPVVTPNCLMNEVYNILGVEKPVLGYLLDEVCAETPILAPIYYGEETPEETEALKTYELVNYDMFDGNRYWAEWDKRG